MANNSSVPVVIRDALKGDSIGKNYAANIISASRETLTGDSVGLDTSAIIISASRETLTGDSFGKVVPAEIRNVSRETLTGDRAGITYFGGANIVIREVLIKDAPFKAMSAIREVLVQLPGEPLTIHNMVAQFGMTTAQRNSTRPLPITVKSLEYIHGVREMIAQYRVVPLIQHGFDYAQTTVEQIAIHKVVQFAGMIRSPIMVGGYRQLALVSRTKGYAPVSADYVYTLRMSIASRRVVMTAQNVRSPVRAFTERMLVLLSKRTPGALVEAWVSQFRMMAAQKRDTVMLRSEIATGSLTMLAAALRIAPAPESYRIVPSEIQQAVLAKITPAIQYSQLNIFTQLQQVALHRVPSPLPPTPMFSHSFVEHVVSHRETALPGATSTWRVYANRALVTARRDTIEPIDSRSPISMASLRIRFIMFRTTPAPIDVVDPASGRHVKAHRMMAAQHRVTEPPETITTTSRFVFNIAAQPVIGDTSFPPSSAPTSDALAVSLVQVPVIGDQSFPAPGAAASEISLFGLLSAAILGDETFADPTIPNSDATMTSFGEWVAIGDTAFVDPTVPNSDAVMSSLNEHVILGDVFPDPALPNSDATVFAVSRVAVLGDDSFPPATSATSEAFARSLGQFAAIGDALFADPRVPNSDALALAVIELIILHDPTLMRIPLRTNRRRPLVSVSIT